MITAPRRATPCPRASAQACGPMSTSYCEPVRRVIENVTSKGVHAHFLDQRYSSPLRLTACAHTCGGAVASRDR